VYDWYLEEDTGEFVYNFKAKGKKGTKISKAVVEMSKVFNLEGMRKTLRSC
jgi:hypothetical protein